MPTQTPEKRKLFTSTLETEVGRVLVGVLRAFGKQHILARSLRFALPVPSSTAQAEPVLNSIQEFSSSNQTALLRKTPERTGQGRLLAAGLVVLVAMVTGLGLAHPGKTAADTNGTINFQARLSSAAGAIAADGDYNVEFKLYTGLSGGSALWTEDHLNTNSQGITVKNGYLSANLGSVTAFPSTINWDQDLYLGMTVRGTGSCSFGSCTPNDAEMTPRLKLTSTPYAFAAGKVSQYNATTGYTSAFSLQAPTGGDQNFVVQDQGAAGTYHLLTSEGAAGSFLQLQGGTPPGTAQIGNFNISGTGIAGNLQVAGGGALDTATAGALNLGTTTAGSVNIGKGGVAINLQGTAFLGGSGTLTTSLNTIVRSATTFSSSYGGGTIYGFDNTVLYAPTSSSIANIYGHNNVATVGGSIDISTVTGFNDRIGIDSSYSGANPITSGTAISVQAPTFGSAGQYFSSYNGINIAGSANGDGTTSGTITNKSLNITTTTAAAGAGGTVNNYGISLNVPNGSGAGTTSNYGLYIQGNGGSGGAGTTGNYAIYDSSTAFNYFAGNIGIGTSSGSNALNVSGSGSFSSSVLTPTVDAVSAGPLNIGTTTATSINLGSSNVVNTLIQATSVGIQSNSDSTTAFTINNSSGASVFGVDDLNTNGTANVAVNGGAELGSTTPTSWAAHGSATLSRDATIFAAGTASAKAVTTGATQGLRDTVGTAVSANTTYNVSFSIRTATASLSNANLAVVFSPDGTTSNNATCAAGTNATLSTTAFTKFTCIMITTATTTTASAYLAIYQTDSTARSIYVDNLSIVSQNSSATKNSAIIHIGGATSQSLTLLQLDTYAGNPFTGSNAAMAGSMYFDTTAGSFQCYNGTRWGACGVAPNTSVTLAPEYAGAVLHGSGSGTMTADLCSDDLNINDGSSGQPTICGSGETNNFYKWTSTSGSTQTFSIYVSYKLPSNFKNFVAGATTMLGKSDATSNSVQYTAYKNVGGTMTACGSAVSVSSGVQTSWQTGTASGSADPSNCSFAAGNTIVFKVDVTSMSNGNAYAGNINFQYTSQ